MTSAASQGKAAAHDVEDSRALEVGMRLGLAAYALVHLLIAWIALQVAWTTDSGSADSTGALRTLGDSSFGTALLWAVAVGMAALVCWQVLDAAIGHTRHDGFTRIRKRVTSAGRAVIYGLLAYQAVSTATGSGGSSSSEESMTAQLMGETGGRWLVGAIGLAIIGIGVALAVKGASCRFTKDLQLPATSGRTGDVVLTVGQVGYIAKGVALAIVGGLFVWAAATHDAQKAGGLDEALKTLLEQPFGAWLLSAVALGIAAFGVYCIAWARWPDPSN